MLEITTKTCPKCDGDGWVWWDELDSYDGSAKICDGCGGARTVMEENENKISLSFFPPTMPEYIIKQGNIVKFFPRELEEQAKAVLGTEPTATALGDNRHLDKSYKIDSLHYASYIATGFITDADFEAIRDTIVKRLW